jgi:hypothetical protein
MRYVLTDGSIDEDRAYDDIPKSWWLESPKTRALLALLVMCNSPEITGDPISAKPGKARKDIREEERAVTFEARETARAERVAVRTGSGVDPSITNEIKRSECEGIKGAVIKQKLDMFALHEAAYKAARGADAYNNKVAALLEKCWVATKTMMVMLLMVTKRLNFTFF